ncbi:MAG: RimJ/RimL family protein N-acetyltransferase [Flammeovirgaceae bacterium]|jgi:RimJ/RimL family protein N-acetyltransferase
MASELSTKALDHLGLVSGMCEELDLVNQIDSHFSQDLEQREVSIGIICKPSAWGNGFATEGAKRCLEFGFSELNLDKVHSVATKVNVPSISIMKKIGMREIQEFYHYLMMDNERLKTCVLYLVEK